MRKIAFGYSTRCNIRCSHCVAAGEKPESSKMELIWAKDIIREMAAAEVKGISFTAGEPLIYLDDIAELVDLCRENNIYTRVVTNSFWARSPKQASRIVSLLQESGLCQLRLSYSRWHQEHVPKQNILYAAKAAVNSGVDYFVSFVTDFTESDESYEQFLRDNRLKFFPEPLIYSGRAGGMGRKPILTDYQDNRCAMNPYLAPDLTMYGCCDAGSHFTNTGFFRLGNLKSASVDHLFTSSEKCLLYNCIRHIGITTIASFAGMASREIVNYRKCELCMKLFDDPAKLKMLEDAAAGDLQRWAR